MTVSDEAALHPALEPMTSYAEACRSFRWQVPATFNFGADVVDYWARDPDRLALVWENAAGESRTYTFAEMARLTNRFANMLARHGVGRGDRVVVMMPRRPEWQIALVGCLKLGAVPIPCIEMLTPRDLAYRIDNSGACAVVCRAEQTPKLDGIGASARVRISLGAAEGWLDLEAEMAGSAESFAPVRTGADEPVIIYYTSGSTGHPKGVTHAARALHAWRIGAHYWLGLSDGDRIWCPADTGWSKAGTSILFGPWSQGATSFFYDGPFEPRRRLELLAKHRINVFCAPSTELFRIVNEEIDLFDLSALKRTVSAGEAVSPPVAAAWKKATGLDVVEAYGLTESLMNVLNYPGERLIPGSMGRPQPGLDMDIVDDRGHRLPPGEEGHIALLTPHPQLMLGYWRDPERTAKVFVDGPDGRWFITGDTGTKDADGYFFYTGRSDDVINSAGYRIGPLEVENALLEHPSVQECAVVPSPDAERGEIVKAYVVLREGFEPDDALARELQEHVKAITAPYKYPRAVAFIAELPKTMTGKILRRALRDREREQARFQRPNT